MNRRELLKAGLAAGAVSALSSWTAFGKESDDSLRIIDTNVSLFQWPFRRLPLDEAVALETKLRSLGITQAWAGSFEGLLHRDISAVNQRLGGVCKRHATFIPIGSINPELPGWQEDLRLCVELHQMPGIRLHPNYHGYTLDDARFTKLLAAATEAGRFVQIAAAMEDTRMQLPQMQVPDVDLAPLIDALKTVPKARVQILNLNPKGALLDKLAALPGVCFDTARVESTDGVPTLLRKLPAGRLMFGSNAPFLIPESALVRVHESGLLNEAELRAVFAESAADGLLHIRR